MIGSEICVKGWVKTKRGNKNVSFIALNDGGCIQNLQIVAEASAFDEELIKKITTGACLRVNGLLVASQGKGQSVEVQAREIEIYGEAD
ncbi:MAG: OB-fold nucleic acid binding domain-containing protein, partial [Bacteroidales bacterium]|nr:OB-fold nucleic acid binding domain-containing protein [Bacteroidales bacterium]